MLSAVLILCLLRRDFDERVCLISILHIQKVLSFTEKKSMFFETSELVNKFKIALIG